MKRSITKIFTIAACAAMMLTAAPVANMQSVQAATNSQGTINLATKKLVISKGVKTAMTNNTLQMVKGRRYQVKAKFGSTTVSKTGTYKSSKPAVATVSSTGLVTAKAPGTTTIKVTYNGKSQSFKVKVSASHSHAWKTINKATCAAKGKKLCQTCGATGTTAMKTTHDFKVTKKATCARKGTQTCTDCGVTESIAKTAHDYRTATWEQLEGRGTPRTTYDYNCGGCGVNMTNWTQEQKNKHRNDFDNFQCFMASITGAIRDVYPQYFMVKKTEITCKNCGIWKNKFQEDLYECDGFGNRLTSSATTATIGTTVAHSSKGANIVLEDTESDVILVDDNIAGDTDIADSEEVSTDAPVISDNTAVSDNNTDITDPNGGSDIVFEDDSFDDEEDSDSDGVLVIEDDDEEVIEDE